MVSGSDLLNQVLRLKVQAKLESGPNLYVLSRLGYVSRSGIGIKVEESSLSSGVRVRLHFKSWILHQMLGSVVRVGSQGWIFVQKLDPESYVRARILGLDWVSSRGRV